MTLRLNGSASGYVELDCPAVGGNNNIKLPASNGSANNLLKNSGTAGELEFASNVNIDSSGRLLVGTSTSASIGGLQSNIQAVGASAAAGSIGIRRDTNDTGTPYLSIGKSRGLGSIVVLNNDPLGEVRFSGADGTDTDTVGATITAYVDGTPGANSMPGRLVFSTTADGASSPTERMRIASDGQTYWGVQTPGTADFGTSFGRNGSAGFFENYRNANATTTVANIGGTLGNAIIRGDGDLENTNNRYTGISDIKFKQNIEDAGSQWDDIKEIRVRKYELIANPDRKHIGVVAQELEEVCPGLVIERIHDEETGETAKSVAYSVLYMKAVKALQEAMERIETLEAKVAALEAS